MTQKHIEITRSNNKNFATENRWFQHCSEKQIPYVTVKVHGKLADVQWDYINLTPEIDGALFEQKNLIHPAAESIYSRIFTKSSWIGLGPGTVSFKNIPRHYAGDAADQLFDVVNNVTTPLLLAIGKDT